jgi:hypothetical protein
MGESTFGLAKYIVDGQIAKDAREGIGFCPNLRGQFRGRHGRIIDAIGNTQLVHNLKPPCDDKAGRELSHLADPVKIACHASS